MRQCLKKYIKKKLEIKNDDVTADVAQYNIATLNATLQLLVIYTKIKIMIKPRSTYPKTLNSKARLWNGKMLGTHSAQTEFGLLNFCDQCIPLCMT